MPIQEISVATMALPERRREISKAPSHQSFGVKILAIQKYDSMIHAQYEVKSSRFAEALENTLRLLQQQWPAAVQ